MNDKTEHVENTVREAIESGDDIYFKVREITLKALTERELDGDNIAAVVQAVGKGIRAGMDRQYGSAKEVLQQSGAALDDSLASAAEATKLALEEASSRLEDYSQSDLKKSMDDLKGLEEMLLDTLGDIARESQGVASDVAEDFIRHLQLKGSAVGNQVRSILESVAQRTLSPDSPALSSARRTAANLAQIGSGFLAGIAESLSAERRDK